MDLPFLIILVLAFGALWFMSSRTRKQQREAADFRANLAIGDEVMTGSGLFGTVTAVDGDVVTLESTPGNETRWLRAAIARRVDPPAVEEPDAQDAQDDTPVVPDDLSSLPPEPPTRRDDDDTK